MRTAPLRLTPLLALLLALPALGAEPPDFTSLWPFIYVERAPEGSAFEALGPIVYYEKGPDGSMAGLRPLFGWRREAEAQRTVWSILYPLSYFRTEPQVSRQFFFPLWFHYSRIAPDGNPVSASVVFPFFWWGKSPKEKGWLHILLVGGTMKGILGIDAIHFYSFLYVKVRIGDYIVHYFPWPLVSVGSGGGRTSFRVWPLYGRTEQKGEWWNGFFLWPFFTYGHRDAYRGKQPAGYFMLFPLYGQAISPDRTSGSVQVLWPFFYYGWDDKAHYREWRLPLPIFLGKRSDTEQTLNIWPLWGTRRLPKARDSYYLWPFFFHSWIDAADHKMSDFKVFPFFTHVREDYPSRDVHRSYWLFWPLWRSETARQAGKLGGMANSLQLAWFNNSEEFDRTYNALLGLFEHQSKADGRRSTRFLWRFFRYERGPGWSSVQLGPLASWTRSDRLTRSSFLLGLIQTGQRDGKRGWRIFYLPFGARLTPPEHGSVEGKAHGAQ